MRKSALALFMAALLLSFFAGSGCGGLQSRIRENQNQFATFPPEAQAQIQNGRIDKGFTEDMVYIAKGNPDDKESITRDGKKIIVWKYSRPIPALPVNSGGSANLSTPYGYPIFGPTGAQPPPLFYERGFFKIEFENGKVVRWDKAMQSDPALK